MRAFGLAPLITIEHCDRGTKAIHSNKEMR
jgi:hypothetical protein